MKRIVILVLFFISFICYVNAETEKINLSDIECIDGDTFRATIDNKKETIRLIAIDTPETKYSTKLEDEPYAEEASNFTCNSLTNSNSIYLEYDQKSKKTDKYGRILGWIYVDDVLLQKELVSKGYAKVEYVYDKYKYVDELYEEENKAKKDKVGIWENEQESEEIKEDKSTVDKIVDYVVEKIKKLFENIYNSIKNYINKFLKKEFSI